MNIYEKYINNTEDINYNIAPTQQTRCAFPPATLILENLFARDAVLPLLAINIYKPKTMKTKRKVLQSCTNNYTVAQLYSSLGPHVV